MSAGLYIHRSRLKCFAPTAFATFTTSAVDMNTNIDPGSLTARHAPGRTAGRSRTPRRMRVPATRPGSPRDRL